MTYYTRAQIGLRPPRSVKTMSRSDGLAWHDVGIPGPLSPAVVAGEPSAIFAQLRNMQSYHMDTNYLTPGGGSDIAYSFAVSQRGDIYELRGWGVAGGHTSGANSTCHGVLFLIGNGEKEGPTPAAQAAARWLIAEHSKRFGSGWSLPHREVAGNPSGTSCPGGAIIAAIRSGFSAGATPTTPEEEPEVIVKDLLLEVDGGVYLTTVFYNADGTQTGSHVGVHVHGETLATLRALGVPMRKALPIEADTLGILPTDATRSTPEPDLR